MDRLMGAVVTDHAQISSLCMSLCLLIKYTQPSGYFCLD